jgi:hypothetical protein
MPVRRTILGGSSSHGEGANVALKLASFLAVLALIFAAAALAGDLVSPLHDPADEGETMAMGIESVRGLAVADSRFSLELDTRTAIPGAQAALTFRIRDKRGMPVRDFGVEHTKRMHVIVVRRDLTDFQHVHPVQRADGSWTVPLVVHDAGSYRVFADFAVDGTPHTLADDIQSDGRFVAQPLPAPTTVAATDGFDVSLLEGPTRANKESELRFAITRDGQRVRVQDYLGAKGHLVALRQGDLAFLHVHPDADTLKFESTFPSAGRYRLFLQFKVGGRVHTVAFTQEVLR